MVSVFVKELDDFVCGLVIKDYFLWQVFWYVWMIYLFDGFLILENQGMMCNISFVDIVKGLVVVDFGVLVQIGEMVIWQIRKVFDKLVIVIINIYYYGDYWLGNYVYVDVYGESLLIYVYFGMIKEIQGVQGNMWCMLMEQWINQVIMGICVVLFWLLLENGNELKFGDVILCIYYFGVVYMFYDLCIEVFEDSVMLIGDVVMDYCIVNMDDGFYFGIFKVYDSLEKMGS